MQGGCQQLGWRGPAAWKKMWWVPGECGVGGGAAVLAAGEASPQEYWILQHLAISQCPSALSPPGSGAQQLWYNPFTAVCLRPAHHCRAPLPAPATLPLQNRSLGGDVCLSPQLCGFARSC